MKKHRHFAPDRYYIVDWSGDGKVYKTSYASDIRANIVKSRRERDTGKTLHVNDGAYLNYEFNAPHAAPLTEVIF